MNKKIGIWGLGIVGKSAVAYFHQKNYQIEVLDKRTLNEHENQFLAQHNAAYFTDDQLLSFLQRNEYILPSAGIDLRPYAEFTSKWLSELDIFAQECHKPIIAITGSVGKTTTTHLLSQVVTAHGKKVFTGGNIGIGLLDSIDQANAADYIILEVSSFQLERCTTFAPDLALWTNLYPNHLDRHGTLQDYFNAKLPIITHQKQEQKAILPLALFSEIRSLFSSRSVDWFCVDKPTHDQINKLLNDEKIYYLHDTAIMMYQNNQTKEIAHFEEIPAVSYVQNSILICAALHTLQISLTNISEYIQDNELPEHRLEKVATIGNIDFYNDSKATIPASTLAALEKLRGKPIILFLGGISKGVDRRDFIKELQGKVSYVYCFGKEAEQLKSWCDLMNIPARSCTTLQDAFFACIEKAQAHDIVLFSPAGASFDLFENYQARGNSFKKLVQQFENSL